MTKRGSSFDIKVVIYIGGELAYEIFVIRECLYYERCSEVFMYFLLFLLHLSHVYWSLTI